MKEVNLKEKSTRGGIKGLLKRIAVINGNAIIVYAILVVFLDWCSKIVADKCLWVGALMSSLISVGWSLLVAIISVKLSKATFEDEHKTN